MFSSIFCLMAYDAVNNQFTLSPEMERLQKEKRSGIELQRHKIEDWNDNSELYRNTVKTNRLTQRQAVNIPLMKETVKTLLSKIDDAPHVVWRELSGDEQKKLIFQEIWNQQYKDGNFEIVDILDKKNVLLHGFSMKKLNLTETGVSASVLDTFDTLIDPLTNVWDIDSARFIIHQNIFRTVQEILADPKYSEEGKHEMKIWADSPPGLTQGNLNREQWEKKMERLRAMGIGSRDFQYFAGGDRLVALTEHFTSSWNHEKQEFERRVVVYADDKIELSNESLKKILNVDFWPFVRWSEDLELNDIYPDSVADLVRTPNKVLNVWFSQLIENRTLKNFQMHWYMPGSNYTPQTYVPGPGVMLPAPPGEDINKVIKPVEVSGLDDSLVAIQSIIQIVERGTGATALQKGATEQGARTTLGEVEIKLGQAMERATAMSKFYRRAWYEFALKWSRLIDANAPRLMKLYKISRSGKIYPKMIYRSDWRSEAGYEPEVSSTSEQENEITKGIQRFQFVLKQFPNNKALLRIAQKRELELLDLSPAELREVEEDQMKQSEAAGAGGAPGTPPEQTMELGPLKQLASVGAA